MAKLTSVQKTTFRNIKFMIGSMGEYAFLFDRETGRSFIAVFTGGMKTHVRIVVSYCGTKDTFKKKVGFVECVQKLINEQGVVVPAHGSMFSLTDELRSFVWANFEDTEYLETL